MALIFGTASANTWVRLRWLPEAQYAENGVDAPEGACAVFVSVLQRTLEPTDVLAGEAEAIARSVADVCGRPRERVHVFYEPPAAGRVAFGGKLVR